MLIFSQDRKMIIECVTVTVKRNFGGRKSEKYLLVGGNFGIVNNILASYEDEKTAMYSLEKIFEALDSGAKSYRL